MSKNIWSNEAFADWIAKQPANGTYNYQSALGCMIHQYLESSGFDVLSVNYVKIEIRDGIGDYQTKPTPKLWDKVCRGARRCPQDGEIIDPSWTYGKALKRIRKLMKETA